MTSRPLKKGDNMKTDIYTKVILTIIAICLIVNIFKPIFQSQKAIANNNNETMYGTVYEDVVQAIYYCEPIDVEIIGEVEITGSVGIDGQPIYVEVE